ncbi:MAG: sulfotransferase [Rhodospirillales bacterium]|nr:sulfotransferase [Rhodospirillales bacterium]
MPVNKISNGDGREEATPTKLLTQEGRAFLEKNDLASAIEKFSEAFTLSGGRDVDSVFLLGAALVLVPRVKAAEKAFLTTLRLDPSHVEAARGLAVILESQAREKEALEFLEGRGMEGEPMLRDTYLEILLRAGNPTYVWDNRDEMIAAAAPTASTYFFMAQSAAAIRQWHEAEQYLRKSATSDDFMVDEMFFREAIRILAKSGTASTGREISAYFSDLVRTTPDESTLFLELAQYVPTNEQSTGRFQEVFSGRAAIYDSIAHTDFSTRIWKTMQPPSGQWGTPPVIDETSMTNNINNLHGIISTMLERKAFSVPLDNIARIRKACAPTASDPVLVLSTGRCGTEGMDHALETSGKIVPHHTMPWRMMPGDRNHILYRLLTGKLAAEPLEGIFTTYLECRTAEMMHAYSQDKTPAFINHWDTIFAPLLATVFPESRFIYLHRDETPVMKSILGKSQWRNRQLQYWRFDSAFPEGRFVFDEAPGIPLEANIAWYLHVTKTFANAFSRTIHKQRFAAIKAEKLFCREGKEIARLLDFLPQNASSEEHLMESFKEKRNDKSSLNEIPEDALSRSAVLMGTYLDRLGKWGSINLPVPS